MDLIKEHILKSKYKNEKNFFETLSSILSLGIDETDYSELEAVHNKEAIISLAINFINSLLSADLINTKEEKLAMFNLLDELNFRSEVLHSIADKKFSSDFEQISKRLGKKFMSSVKE